MNEENREIRGYLLMIIADANPYGASFRMIKGQMEIYGFHYPEERLKAHLKYLLDKEYITLSEIERGNVTRRINTVTPKGVDLLEGNTPRDPGVMIIE